MRFVANYLNDRLLNIILDYLDSQMKCDTIEID